MKKKRIIAFLICVSVVAFLLFSSFLIVHEAGHDCIGEGCRICAYLQNCARNLKDLSAAVAGPAAAAAFVFAFSVCAASPDRQLPQRTLITLKVKLSN